MANEENKDTGIDAGAENTQQTGSKAEKTESKKVTKTAAKSTTTKKATTSKASAKTKEVTNTETKSGKASKVSDTLETIGNRLLQANPKMAAVYMTTDGRGFNYPNDALNHARTLTDQTVTRVKRK